MDVSDSGDLKINIEFLRKNLHVVWVVDIILDP